MRVLIFFGLLLGGLTLHAQRSVIQYSIEQFYKTISYGGGNFHQAENKILIHDNSSGIFNVYEIDLLTRGKKTLTKSDKESYFMISYLPGTSHFLYTADKGGNENSHIYLQRTDGSVTDLTPGEKEKAFFTEWKKGKTAFYYGSNVRDPKYFDVYKMSIDNWKPELLYKNDEGFEIAAISPNER